MNEYVDKLFNTKYYDHEKVMKEIKKIIYEELSDVIEYTTDMDKLDKLVCNNVKCRLTDVNLDSTIINISDFEKPEHEFLLANFKDTRKKTNYVLIDITCRQFIESDEKYEKGNNPGALLKTSNESLLNDLLNCGCSMVTSESFKDYLNSFGINSTLNDVLDKYKEEPYETDIKNNKKR